ncbi:MULTISPECIES: type VI secretion system baseplate subunit TssF [Niastella]|uniref:Type VI secretion system baseplate subunit TssF n=1 Tax=Niastella soli TaxID=2821487 RepID=A0ABS3Z587_9BACT|nr:type VI secretion system baseplate subunit TssF [Niastella soli]MBO9205314.1 type VI secretion system baseplate subunit TssF [Niastella soli]
MENREQIKNRMMKTAARLWGYPEDESESSFDPLVNVLFSATALELEKISNEVHASRARLLERMVQLLSPEVLCGPLPAHGILHAKSIEDAAWLKESDQFFSSQKKGANYENGSDATGYRDFFFTSTGPFQLNTAAVSYLATGHQLFRYREMISKEVITHCLPGRELEQRVLWIGLTGPRIKLHNTQYYFEIRNEVNKELFYKNLADARWFYGEQEMEVVPGYNQENISGEHLNIEQLLIRKNTASWKLKEFVNAYYKPKFITIRQLEKSVAEQEGWPSELLQAFDKKELQSLQADKVHWLKIQFPENIATSVLQDVICHVNCFPVINCKLHETMHHMHDILNIVPMYTNDIFFDLHEIADQDGHVFNTRDLEKTAQTQLTMILRQGGIGRFDERDATMIIENIVQLLSDESAAFSVLGRDFLSGELKNLQQIIYKLEQQMITRELNREYTPFLVVRKENNSQLNNLTIAYWSTAGEQGNDIKAGTTLQSYKTNSMYHADCTLITTTIGGRNRLSASESITAYKSALLSRDRLISLEDIKIFCRLQMGNTAKHITVKKGVMVPRQVSQGFTRTIDVTIKLNRKDFMDAQDKNQLQYWKDSLVLKLSTKSAGLTPFRVFIEQEN